MILIVGCGFLGSYLLKHITENTDEPVLATVRSTEKTPQVSGAEFIKCDIGNSSDLQALAKHCEGQSVTVFYFAACHYIDYIYENPKVAYKINIDALENFINTIPNIKKLFFASTDCVYGEGEGKDFKFKENSELKPVSEYGKQKIMAENIIISKGFTVLRLPFMLGKSLSQTPHFYDKITASLINGEEVEMIDGMYRSVLSYSQVAQIMYKLSCLAETPQIINVCSDNSLTKYQMGVILAENNNAPVRLIKKITEAEGEKFFKDKRASFGAMDNTLLKSLLGVKNIKWEEEKC